MRFLLLAQLVWSSPACQMIELLSFPWWQRKVEAPACLKEWKGGGLLPRDEGWLVGLFPQGSQDDDIYCFCCDREMGHQLCEWEISDAWRLLVWLYLSGVTHSHQAYKGWFIKTEVYSFTLRSVIVKGGSCNWIVWPECSLCPWKPNGKPNYHLKSCSSSKKVKEEHIRQRQKHLKNTKLWESRFCWKSYSYSSTVGARRTSVGMTRNEAEGGKEGPDPEWCIQCSRSWSSQQPFSQKEIPLFVSIVKAMHVHYKKYKQKGPKNCQACLPTKEDQSYALVLVLLWQIIKYLKILLSN